MTSSTELTQFPKCELSPTALSLKSDITFEEYEQIGKTLHRMEGAIQFWIGDWINAGEKAFGEKYAQAIEVTGYDVTTLRDCAWICGKVESSLRNDKLTFNHHREVAKLPAKQQDKWLKAAAEHGMSTRILRHSIAHGKVLTAQDIEEMSGANSGLSLPNKHIEMLHLWKRNVLDADQLERTAETARQLKDEVIVPLKELVVALERALERLEE